MPADATNVLSADELLAADRLLVELLAERVNTVDIGAAVAPRPVEHDVAERPAAAAG